MKKYTLYVGLNDKDSKIQKVSTLEAYKLINNLLMKYFDGATIYDAMGIYRHDNGEFVTENTLRIEILEFDNPIIDAVKKVVGIIKDLLNQESVAVQIENVQSDLW